MKIKLTTFIAFLSFGLVNSQTIYEEFQSAKLGTSRELKIQLPRNYEENTEKLYPIFIVFDGDYLFEPVAGNVDYYSYWEDMPEAIVVGINQVDSRGEDNHYSDQTYFPVESGAKFFEFIGMELIPYIEDKYRTANFRVAVGHGETANFINYFLFKKEPLFNAYMALSPDLAISMLDNLPTRLSEIERKIFYYLATSTNDIKPLREDANVLNTRLSALENKNIFFGFNEFDGPTHYSLPAHAIPNALESMFFVFQPISKKEYTERILTLETSPVAYLNEKYEMINELFNIEKQVLVNDFKAIAAAIEKNKAYDEYESLGKLARKEYPDTLLGNYYLGRFYEETGEPKKAMRTYKSAYILEEIGGYTKDEMMERADAIKRDFGY
ncbi:alpha/beta hydrolase-fold protein [Flavobacteriaceae bacterium S0825]|uniref:alpha/beta hydrolase n=1 Tax=Gaetbulibacter sp. S0825 TaxID=2720084 RepID=UPI001430E26A|nr:alpha/beta hydrolase-fold protein [Gaetbulibacter sp. S0825]MCK0108079.1 alpha/beta hydrolase-fold protein [Flavobacteriaceae bacterium S0825]NIX63715.1 esterase [Gaetbulibacter sp. S0825]